MQVKPVDLTPNMDNPFFKPQPESTNGEKAKKIGVEDINPSFKRVLYETSCQPIKPQAVFQGHWPTYNTSPVFDVNGIMFPLTIMSKPIEKPFLGHLNYFA